MPEQERIAGHIAAYSSCEGGLLELLHAIQHDLGYIPPAAIPAVASGMGLSRAEVHGVITFYDDFHTEPRGRHRLQVCRAEACQAVGGEALAQYARDALGVDFGQTTADGGVTLEEVYCLGNCACSPSVRLDDDVYARVDAARLDQLLDELGRGP